jgi:hypothetical protein
VPEAAQAGERAVPEAAQAGERAVPEAALVSQLIEKRSNF